MSGNQRDMGASSALAAGASSPSGSVPTGAWKSVVFWGPVIEVDGVRPDWLADQEPFVWVKTYRWLEHHKGPACYSPPFCARTSDWCWSHRDGDPCIRAIRLPVGHPAYASASGKPLTSSREG